MSALGGDSAPESKLRTGVAAHTAMHREALPRKHQPLLRRIRSALRPPWYLPHQRLQLQLSLLPFSALRYFNSYLFRRSVFNS